MKIRPYPGGRWQADCGIIEGRRIRTVFQTKAEAQQFMQMMQERKAAARLGMADLDMRTAQDAKRAAAILSGRTTLTTAAEFWSDNHRESSVRRLDELIACFLKHLDSRNCRPRYIDGIANTLKIFLHDAGDRMAGDCTTEIILYWLNNRNWSKQTFANRRRELSVFFNWCVKQGILALNPVARIPSPKLDERKIEVLTVDQSRRLLNGLEGSDRAYFAIALFAGLRPGEIDRLTWDEVKLDRGHIELLSRQAKGRSRRLVTIQPNLAAWLKTMEFQPTIICGTLKELPISRCDKCELMKRACYAAGLSQWPQDVCRHSFASYHLARWKNANETAHELGHTTTAMLYRHYREVVTEQEAEAFWNIFPGTAAVIPFSQSAHNVR